jgi:hypothetical protein
MRHTSSLTLVLCGIIAFTFGNYAQIVCTDRKIDCTMHVINQETTINGLFKLSLNDVKEYSLDNYYDKIITIEQYCLISSTENTQSVPCKLFSEIYQEKLPLTFQERKGLCYISSDGKLSNTCSINENVIWYGKTLSVFGLSIILSAVLF